MVSGIENQGLPAISPMVQNLGMRLRKAFTSLASTSADVIPQPELSRVIFIAAGAESRAKNSTDYRNTWERITADLRTAKAELEEVIAKFKPRNQASGSVQREQDVALFTLARINAELGNHEEAEVIYVDLHSSSPIKINSMHHCPQDAQPYIVDINLAYLELIGKHERTLDQALKLSSNLLASTNWEMPRSKDEECKLRLIMIQIHNARGDYKAATAQIRIVEGLYETYKSMFLHIHTSIKFFLQRAVTLAGLGEEHRSRQDFVAALVRSATILGIWHSETRQVLFEYGKTLREWGDDIGAASILTECCLGSYHQLGRDQPLSIQRYNELKSKAFVSSIWKFKRKNSSHQEETAQRIRLNILLILLGLVCDQPQSQLDALQMFNDTASRDESRLSMAYEHIHLNTIIDLLKSSGGALFDKVEDFLQELVDNKSSLRVDTEEHGAIYIFRIHRALARCRFEQGKTKQAIQSIIGSDTGFKRSAEGALQSNLDLIMLYNADSSTKAKAVELSRSVFFDVDIKLNRNQAAAFHRKLLTLDATHFTYASIVNSPLPITVLENVGTGAYATVESVEIVKRLYARKSIALPRYSQNGIRQSIQNEISVIRTLKNPHIVQIYCTYEEKSRFSIILQPLADCDLEAYLEQHINNDRHGSVTSHQKLIWKWLRCLSNTLAFIHSKGIRHKDIKTRNVLVKDSEVIFADFGSSHAFFDEGTSVTDGPAYGHTLMYCAPEVVSWDNRGRSADIFSLGCVFTEMATTLDDRSISDYYEFRFKDAENQARATHAYHATLDLVDSWFSQENTSLDVFSLYLSVLKPMLGIDPSSRPTALDTSNSVQAVFRDCFAETLPTCSSCLQKPWEGPIPRCDAELTDTGQ